MSKLLTPAALAIAGFILAISISVAGIYLLAGLGWSLIAGSVPFYLTSIVIFKGLARG